MMKKMIPNDMFYAHYPYRPDMEDSVILQILSAYCRIIFIRFGSMFVGSQNFPGSWGHDFVGTCSKFWTILISIKQILVYTFVGM